MAKRQYSIESPRPGARMIVAHYRPGDRLTVSAPSMLPGAGQPKEGREYRLLNGDNGTEVEFIAAIEGQVTVVHESVALAASKKVQDQLERLDQLGTGVSGRTAKMTADMQAALTAVQKESAQRIADLERIIAASKEETEQALADRKEMQALVADRMQRLIAGQSALEDRVNGLLGEMLERVNNTIAAVIEEGVVAAPQASAIDAKEVARIHGKIADLTTALLGAVAHNRIPIVDYETWDGESVIPKGEKRLISAEQARALNAATEPLQYSYALDGDDNVSIVVTRESVDQYEAGRPNGWRLPIFGAEGRFIHADRLSQYRSGAHSAVVDGIVSEQRAAVERIDELDQAARALIATELERKRAAE